MPDDLLQRSRDGDPAAWRALLDLHGPSMLGLARDLLRRLGPDGIQAEDLLQEVWTALLGGGPAEVPNPRAYLASAVVHAALKHRRAEDRRRARERARPLPGDPLLEAGDVEEALSRIEPAERLILRWIYWDGLSYAQVARLHAVPENSVGPLASRARERLREALRKR